MTELLKVNELSVEYPIFGGLLGGKTGAVRAVNNVSFEIQQGETLGLVGESGCGKSTLGKALIRLIEPTRGSIFFKGTDITQISRPSFRSFRKNIQMIFQDPFSSLNPRMRVGDILSEPLKIHNICPASERREKVLSLLSTVGLRAESYDKFPHEFSGGQRQRIGIARALAVEPEFIVADEPVSALDVSIQAQILNLLKKLQQDYKLTYLFISHDLNVIRYLCDRIVVMYLGKIMEVLTREQILDPNFRKHPYTEALIAAAPKKHPGLVRDRPHLKGDIPSPARPPAGCVFHTRCLEAVEECCTQAPKLVANIDETHLVACLKR